MKRLSFKRFIVLLAISLANSAVVGCALTGSKERASQSRSGKIPSRTSTSNLLAQIASRESSSGERSEAWQRLWRTHIEEGKSLAVLASQLQLPSRAFDDCWVYAPGAPSGIAPNWLRPNSPALCVQLPLKDAAHSPAVFFLFSKAVDPESFRTLLLRTNSSAPLDTRILRISVFPPE